MNGKTFVFVFFCLVQISWGRRCYECTGGGNSYCNDPPYLSYIRPVECGVDLICAKITTDRYVERKCAPLNICEIVWLNEWRSCETCEQDLCNASATFYIAKTLPWLLLLQLFSSLFIQQFV